MSHLEFIEMKVLSLKNKLEKNCIKYLYTHLPFNKKSDANEKLDGM